MPLEAILEQFLEDKRLRNLYACDEHRSYIHLAVIARRGKILASATNRNGSRSSGSGYSDRSIHAERNVVKALGNIQELRGADMFVMRMPKVKPGTPKIEFKPSEPCEECKLFLAKCKREYGLRNVFYTGKGAAAACEPADPPEADATAATPPLKHTL
jgi:hypothetical protein